MIELLYTSTKLIPAGAWNAAFVNNWDAFLVQIGGDGYIVYMDGTTISIGNVASANKLIHRVLGRPAWIDTNTFQVSKVYAADEVVGLPDPGRGNFTPWGTWNNVVQGDLLDDELGFFLHRNVRTIEVLSLTTGNLVRSIPSIFSYPDYIADLSWVSPGRVLAASGSTGRFALVDYINGVILSSYRAPGAPSRVIYNVNHKVVFTIQSDRKVRVCTLTAVPSLLSNPAFDPAVVQVHDLEAHKVKVRLTGSEGEPCPGWWIVWELLAPALGALDKPVSKTDEDGYAWNLYFSPSDATVTGSETIKTTVEV